MKAIEAPLFTDKTQALQWVENNPNRCEEFVLAEHWATPEYRASVVDRVGDVPEFIYEFFSQNEWLKYMRAPSSARITALIATLPSTTI